MAEFEQVIKDHYGNISDIRVNSVVKKFLEGDVYYAEFKNDHNEDDFCYIFKTNKETLLFDDGESVIKEFHAKMDKRRNLIQRLNEFGLFDLVAALIAIIFTLVYASLVAIGNKPDNDFIALFTLLIGYLFGKKPKGDQ